MRILSFLILFFILSPIDITFAQEGKIDLLKYSSDFEKHSLQNTLSIAHLQLLLAISPDADEKQLTAVQKRIDDFVNEIKVKNVVGDKKLIKLIHDKTHRTFLKTYK